MIDVKALQLIMQMSAFLDDYIIFDIINFEEKEWQKIEDMRARVENYLTGLGFEATYSDFTGFNGIALGLPGDHYKWGKEKEE